MYLCLLSLALIRVESNKPYFRIHKAMVNLFFQNALENGFIQVGAMKTTSIFFQKLISRDELGKFITDKPKVPHVGFDFFDSLTYGTDPKKVLDEHDYDHLDRC